MKRFTHALAVLVLAGNVAVSSGQNESAAESPASGAVRANLGTGENGFNQGQSGEQAQPPASGPAAFGPGLALISNATLYLNQYDLMVQQCHLSDEQKPRVKEKVDAMLSELKSYVQNAVQHGFSSGRGRATATTLDELAVDTNLSKLRDEVTNVANSHQVMINQELTLDQRYAWERYKLNRLLIPRLAPADLTREQVEKVKNIEDETIRVLMVLTDAKEVPSMYGRVVRKIVSDVLTEEQAGKLLEAPVVSAGGRASQASGGIGIGSGAGRGPTSGQGGYGRGAAPAGGQRGGRGNGGSTGGAGRGGAPNLP